MAHLRTPVFNRSSWGGVNLQPTAGSVTAPASFTLERSKHGHDFRHRNADGSIRHCKATVIVQNGATVNMSFRGHHVQISSDPQANMRCAFKMYAETLKLGSSSASLT